MSKSIQPVIDAFLTKKVKRISNTETDGTNLYLFGNCIAKHVKEGIIISAGGYKPTITTQDRLNMLGARITFRKGKFYKNGIYWNGDWLDVDTFPKEEIKETKQESLFN